VAGIWGINKAQTPLVRFVVDLLYNFHNKFEINAACNWLAKQFQDSFIRIDGSGGGCIQKFNLCSPGLSIWCWHDLFAQSDIKDQPNSWLFTVKHDIVPSLCETSIICEFSGLRIKFVWIEKVFKLCHDISILVGFLVSKMSIRWPTNCPLTINQQKTMPSLICFSNS
jgi:hypothetical protein